MKKRSSSPLGLYTMGIAALFFAGFLALVLFGAETYRDAAGRQLENDEARALVSYLSTCVRGSDRAGNITTVDSEYGQVLTIADGYGYALYIYEYDGQLLEEYRAIVTNKEIELDPEEANVLGKTDVFTVETASENTIRITTSAGDVLVHLRSGEVSG